MIQIPALYLTVAGTAFLAASYAPDLAASGAAAGEAPLAAISSGKGDRLSPPRPASNGRAPATLVEIVGASQPTIVLRGRDGAILYRSDALSGTTVIAKDSDLPIVTLRDGPASVEAEQNPVRREPVVREDIREAPSGPPKARAIGCESAVSPLARGASAAGVSRCLAMIEGPSAS